METIKSKINERSCAMELRLEHLVKDFSGTKAVNDVSITIQDGKLTGLLGPSGCGKSTTLYLISGLESPTSGRIFFGDRDVTALPPEKRGIGLVFQNYALYPTMKVYDNMAFPLKMRRWGREEIRARDQYQQERVSRLHQPLAVHRHHRLTIVRSSRCLMEHWQPKKIRR